MAKNYHINPKTMRPNICRAKTPESCPYYDKETQTPAPHFDDKPEAREYVETVLKKEYGETYKISKKEAGSEKYEDENGNIIEVLKDGDETKILVNGDEVELVEPIKSMILDSVKGDEWEKVEEPEPEPEEEEELNEEDLAAIIQEVYPDINKFNPDDEVYLHPDGRLIHIDDFDKVRVYKEGEELKTVLTPEKLRDGFGQWNREIPPEPEDWKPKSKNKKYQDSQDELIERLATFMEENPEIDFQPKGAVQEKHWDNIKNAEYDGKSEHIKNTMIASALDAIERAGFEVEEDHNAISSPYTTAAKKEGLDKYDIQAKQKDALISLYSQEPPEVKKKSGLFVNPYIPEVDESKTWNNYSPTADPTGKSGVKYDKDNMTDAVKSFISSQRGDEVVSTESEGGLTFKKYQPQQDDTYVSPISVSGNVSEFDFTSEGVAEKFGFHGADVFTEYKPSPYQFGMESVKTLNGVETSAVKWFTGGSYHDFNRVIFKRQGISKSSSLYDNYRLKMRHMDQALAKAPKVDKIVYRGIKPSASIFSSSNIEGDTIGERMDNYIAQNYKVGEPVTFKGYQSTSTSPSMAHSWSSYGDGVMFEIRTPEGLPVSTISQHPGENEVILPRDSHYVVAGVQKTGGKRVVQLVAVNEKGDVLDGTNADQKNTWDELYAQPLNVKGKA